MSPQERDYYLDRAKAERLRAAEATNTAAGAIHAELACLYERLIELKNEKPSLTIVNSERISA